MSRISPRWVWVVLTCFACGVVSNGCERKAHRPAKALEPKSVREYISDLDSSDLRVRIEAIRQLGRFGPDAALAIEPLVRIADRERESKDLRNTADWALTRIGLSLQIQDLQTNPDSEVRESYAGAFGRSQDVSTWRDRSVYMEMVIPALLWSSRNDAKARVRNLAVIGLGLLCDEPAAKASAPSVVPVLIDATGDPDREVRISAVVALGDYGKQAKAALPLLRKMRDHPDEEIRHQVRRGIWCIEEDMKEH